MLNSYFTLKCKNDITLKIDTIITNYLSHNFVPKTEIGTSLRTTIHTEGDTMELSERG